jgi:hypothetical protein
MAFCFCKTHALPVLPTTMILVCHMGLLQFAEPKLEFSRTAARAGPGAGILPYLKLGDVVFAVHIFYICYCIIIGGLPNST